MSLTMEDLCASLSSSHVGQEAMDLAALQLHLTQTLFSQPISVSPTPSARNHAQPCNTPTSRTPSSSFSWSSMHMPSSPIEQRTGDEMFRSEDVAMLLDEDERTVEDLLLMPASPAPQTPKQTGHQSLAMADASPSLFTSTDPFYIAQLEASQAPRPSSVFAQAATPSAQSPFFLHLHAQHTTSLVDAHPLFAAASTFDR
uniref:Uncharacterized protein n=1 Tax=Mycena chlorophos TaxID=658473 RepID=A0ABQ0L5A7_MYCCL|nr:predicted protein [Mycena chlorophos]